MSSSLDWTLVQRKYIDELRNRYLSTSFTPVETGENIDLYGTIDVSDVFFEIVNFPLHEIYQVVKYSEYAQNRYYQRDTDDPDKYPYGRYIGRESRTFFALERIEFLGTTSIQESTVVGILQVTDLEKLYQAAKRKVAAYHLKNMFWADENGQEIKPNKQEGATITLPVITLVEL
ncbi:hypothetical protein K1728_06500 [Weissella confusa]|uniref:hypothetical protein n=1 Tax=Weissella confusa TaxID=1583 RepID=UPI001C6F67E7|nr:hypothetical protein [Weissella confusa]QYU56841.1 hypothetical protein K1728_06500 [Weissella confusa]